MDVKSEMSQKEIRSLLGRLIFRFSFIPIFLGLLVLLPAGTFNFWQVYVYFGIFVIPMSLVLIYFIKRDPRFLERRANTSEKEKQQILISILSTAIFLSGFIVSGLDHRFGWSNIPEVAVILVDILILLGYLIIFSVFKQNSYASNIVEVGETQKVISTGLYGVVRHPMYVGVLIMFIPTPIALGSYWGLIPFAFLPLSLVLRILNEEKLLKENLEGYKEYCHQTKYRLIPFLW